MNALLLLRATTPSVLLEDKNQKRIMTEIDSSSPQEKKWQEYWAKSRPQLDKEKKLSLEGFRPQPNGPRINPDGSIDGDTGKRD